MNLYRKKAILVFVFFYAVSGIPFLTADPVPYDPATQTAQMPGIPPEEAGNNSSTPHEFDPTTGFMGVTPLSLPPIVPPAEEPNTAGELKVIEDLFRELGAISGERFFDNDALEAPKKNNISKAVSFLGNAYTRVKKKMETVSLESFFTEAKIENIEVKQETKSDAPEMILPEFPGETLMQMNLEVTDEVVQAHENFNLNEAHPFMEWLAMREVTNESRQALVEAEAQRKAMAETVKEAEKNGNRVFFIVNGKIVPFFFNIPLFSKGDYQLFIVNDTRPPVSKPA